MATENKCTGNCMNCSVVQRNFCASQLAYNNMRQMETMQEQMAEIQKKIDSMQEKAAAVQEEPIFNPTAPNIA